MFGCLLEAGLKPFWMTILMRLWEAIAGRDVSRDSTLNSRVVFEQLTPRVVRRRNLNEVGS